MAFNIGEPESSSLILVGEFFVVYTEKMQKRGLKVVDVNGVFNNVISELIGFAVKPRLDSTTSEIDTKASRVVISTVVVGC